MNLVTALLALLAIGAIYFTAMLVVDIVKNKDDLGDSNPVIGFIIGFVTDFFDTLGIGSFAPTTLLAKVTGFIKNDRLLPGTLNIGHTIPVLIEAFIFIQGVKVEGVTLFSLIAASVAGALLGGRIVTKLPEKKIQVVMGIALIITAFLMLAKQMGWLALLGENNTAIALTGGMLVVGIVGNFIFGALMMAGVGLYAPCLAMVSMLGLNPKVAFPIMMGSCAALMAFGSPKFIKEGLYPRKGTVALTIGGIIGVVIAAKLVKEMPLEYLIWLVIVVVLITGFDMLRKGFKKA